MLKKKKCNPLRKLSELLIVSTIILFLFFSSSIKAQTYSQSSGTNSSANASYSSSSTNENAVKVSGGTFTMTNCTISKTGATTDTDGSSFYGTNAAILASNNGKIEMSGGTITTNAIGANAIVAYGGAVAVSDVVMTCSQNLSRGIHATGGGTITASNLTITTSGNNSSVIATDRGGGTVTVTGGTYSCSGTDCAVIYSTGDITVNNITGASAIGEMGVIEGSNSITINNSDMTSGAASSSRGLFLMQSFSGDAGQGSKSFINVSGGSLTMTDDKTPLIEVATVVTGTVTLDSVTTTIPSGILMFVDYNTRWDTYGATGVLILSGDGYTYSGNIVVDSYSNAEVTVNDGVTWEGAYDNENTGISTSLTIDGGSWDVTADSYIDEVVINNGISGTSITSITGNGYSVYYDPDNDANSYLNGQSYSLVNGGYLTPEGTTAIENDDDIIPNAYILKQNYPNPFNPTTTISYEIPTNGKVVLSIYDMTGCLVATIVNENQSAGYYSVDWDASRYSSGVYFYQIEADGFQQVKKMSFVK